MECVHKVEENGITYRLYIEQDELPVRGNALASGDDAEDKPCEDEIIERLENGDVWAWANVNVEASVYIEGQHFQGDDWLGGCSYANTADFVQPVKPGEGSYWEDMKPSPAML